MDTQVHKLIELEQQRQRQQLNLIASENYTSAAVREAVGSVLMHKYSEGNIGTRYYEGNDIIDQLEQLTISRATKLFELPNNWGVNTQALSGSNANLAVMLALLEPGDTILSMYLPDGGHLSHGWSYEPKQQTENPTANEPLDRLTHLQGSRKVHVVAKLFNVVQYKTDPQTHLLDYDSIELIAKQYRPKLIITGGTAYPRNIDYKRMKQLALGVGAFYLADVAHEAGLIAAKALPSPLGIADVVTMTTHKTLRSARGALILAEQGIIDRVNKAVLPGLQGGPFNNNIAGICVGLGEALEPDFKAYAQTVLANATSLGKNLIEQGINLVTGGTDKHLLLVDLSASNIKGKELAKTLAEIGIITNMNTIPGETRSPASPSGIRIGTPFITTMGMQPKHMLKISEWIATAIKRELTPEDKQRIQKEVNQFVSPFWRKLP